MSVDGGVDGIGVGGGAARDDDRLGRARGGQLEIDWFFGHFGRSELDRSIVGRLRRKKLETVGEEIWALAEHWLAEVQFFLQAGDVREADGRIETVFTALVGEGDGVNRFAAWLTANELAAMLLAEVEDAAGDGDEYENGYQESEDLRVEVEVDDIEASGLDVASGGFRFVVVDGFVEV